MSLDKEILLTGQADFPPAPLDLRAGPLSVYYENGSIRYIKHADVEVLRMIYAAVRDHNWGTVEPRIRDEHIEHNDRSFHITYQADYRQNDIDFTATYIISGTADGRLRFHMRGQAHSTFKKNRVGFCILHPINECMGQRCRITDPDGKTLDGTFPVSISPHQPFKNIQHMQWRPAEGVTADLHFYGDVFEMEDQRNWTDASYKTYCTPLENPFPVTVQDGEVIEQTVELTAATRTQISESPGDATVLFTTGSRRITPLPAIGVGQSSQRPRLSEQEIALLKPLKFDHLRVDVKLNHDNWQQQLMDAVQTSRDLEIPLDIALTVDDNLEAEIEEFTGFCRGGKTSVQSIRLFHVDKKSTDKETLNRALPLLREALPEVEIGAGTDCFFTELNRERTPTEAIDFLTFSINPQVHAFDLKSLTETLEAQKYVVESAREFAGNKPVHVSPITFLMRFNPNATGPEPEPQPGQLPPTVDPRQPSLYGAGWTLGSLKYLLESGASALTYYETTGWRGIIMGDEPSPLPEKFPANAGDVFPMYQVFKWLREWRPRSVVQSKSSAPLHVDGLVIESDQGTRLILANFTSASVDVQIPAGTVKKITRLNADNIKPYVQDPGRLTAEKIKSQLETVKIDAFGLVCLDYGNGEKK